MTCELVTTQLTLMLYGELSFDEEEALQQHLDGCAPCRAELARMQGFHSGLDRHELRVDSTLLTTCRRQLRIAIAEAERSRTRGILASFRTYVSDVSSAWYWKPVMASALIIAGFVLGRVIPPASTESIGIATRNEPVVATRVRYLEPNENGKVRLVLEEVSQRTLSGEMDDERIRSLLLNAAREAQDPGMRVESVNLLKQDVTSSDDVRRALIHALQNDSNPGVRLKALEGLKATSMDPETRHALSRVVLADDNPGVRTQAIDLLVQKKEPAMVGVLQELMQREDNQYVRMKCQKALREMKASVETF